MRPLITPGSAGRLAGMVRVAPAPDLADVVQQHWVVGWDNRGRPPVVQEVLPDPCVNLAVEPAGVLLYGVTSGPSRHVLAERAQRPPPDDQRALVAEIVAAMRDAEPGMRVVDVAAHFAVAPRTLQRLFAAHVGASPKRVLQRFRHQHAADRLAGDDADLARLAADLGYFDQAHFCSDFRAATGRPPSRAASG